MKDGMENVIELSKRRHDAEGVLADFKRIIEEEPERVADGVVVIMLAKGSDGDLYDNTQLSSHMRRSELVALLEAAKYDQLRKVMG
jgi:hypothetical protein